LVVDHRQMTVVRRSEWLTGAARGHVDTERPVMVRRQRDSQLVRRQPGARLVAGGIQVRDRGRYAKGPRRGVATGEVNVAMLLRRERAREVHPETVVRDPWLDFLSDGRQLGDLLYRRAIDDDRAVHPMPEAVGRRTRSAIGAGAGSSIRAAAARQLAEALRA